MKKKLLLLSFLLLFVFSPSFSSNAPETDVSEDLDQNSETESVSRATTTLFVTGIKSDYYLTPSEIPYSIPYSYLRGSDGAYFSGTINYYYMRYGYIGPLPSVFYYQVFYEGNLDFQFYVY